MLPTLLLAAALLIVASGLTGGRSVAARIAALGTPTSRPRVILGWAAGTFVSYGATALLALGLLGRMGQVVRMPAELRVSARALGLPAEADGATLLWLVATLLGGMALGLLLLWWRVRRGKPPIGLPYRSPATAQVRGERLPAAVLAVSAGVGEELFFRLVLPLLVALVSGSALLGLTVSLVAFAALHRHQGVVGTVAVAFVGGWLTYLYLLTGALWVVMVLHTLIDLHALVLRPWITPSADSRYERSRSPPPGTTAEIRRSPPG